MRSPLFDDVDLDPDLERLAGDLVRQLDAAGSAMDVCAPPLGSLEPGRSRPARRRPLVAAAVALALVGAGIVVTRGNEVADLPVSTGPSTSSQDLQPPPAPQAAPVGWRVVLDPATGFHPTSASDSSLTPPPDLSEPPGYRNGVLYTQHWVAVYARPVDPLGGPLLSVETDYEPIGGVPGALPTHPAPSFEIATVRGAVPAWEWPAPEGVFRFGFMGDDEHLVTVGAFGMSRDEALAAVADVTIGARGAAEMATPPGLVGHRVYESSNEGAFTTYAEADADATEPFARQVQVTVTRGSTGPDLLQAVSQFMMGTLPQTTSEPEVERVTVDGRNALLRRYGDDGALLITFDPDSRRTIELFGQGGIGADELVSLADHVRDVDDATWWEVVDRCRDVDLTLPTIC